MKKRFAAVIIFSIVSLFAVAVSYANQISAREARHRIEQARESIERGIQHGSITRTEANRLYGELDAIKNRFRNMRDDGYLSPMERELLDRDLDRIERHIRREKMDGDGRGRWSDSNQISAREARHRIGQARESIERGIRHGSITRSEARRLYGELDMIKNRFRNMKDDGYLSPMEREALDRDLDRIERHIRREKRDDDGRGRDFGRDRDYDRGRRY